MSFLRRRNRPLAALFLASFLMSTSMLAFVVGGNCLILGVSPYTMVLNERDRWRKFEDNIMSMDVSKSNVIPGLPEGVRWSDLPEDLRSVMWEQSLWTCILVDLSKQVGLSENTLLIIEQELRN